MEWQHNNSIRASMSFIEDLLQGIDEIISGKAGIYHSTHTDLTQEQILLVEDELKQMKSLLKRAKEELNLRQNKIELSKVIAVNCSFIWETIEDSWSDKLEKSYGKIRSKEKKERIDAILRQLSEHNTRIQNLIRN